MIRQVRIRNFKCFESAFIDLAPLTLLTGLNGMGKSTVLQVLLLLRQSRVQGLLPGVGLALNGDLVSVGTGHDALCSSAPDETITLGLTIGDGQALDWSFGYAQDANVLPLDPTAGSSPLVESSLFGDDFYYLQSERLGPRTVFEMSDYQVRLHRQVGPRGEYAAHYLYLFGDQSVVEPLRCHPKAASGQLQHQVEAWLSEVSPDTRVELSPTSGTDLVSLRYSFKSAGQLRSSYRATNVGFGLTYVLPIVLVALTARPGALVLIENLEAHLHPLGQSRLTNLLARVASTGVQVLLETHSDHVVNGVRLAVKDKVLSPEDSAIYYFQRREGEEGGNEAIQIRIDRDGRIDQWPEGFFDEWDKSLAELLTPRPL